MPACPKAHRERPKSRTAIQPTVAVAVPLPGKLALREPWLFGQNYPREDVAARPERVPGSSVNAWAEALLDELFQLAADAPAGPVLAVACPCIRPADGHSALPRQRGQRGLRGAPSPKLRRPVGCQPVGWLDDVHRPDMEGVRSPRRWGGPGACPQARRIPPRKRCQPAVGSIRTRLQAPGCRAGAGGFSPPDPPVRNRPPTAVVGRHAS